MVDLSNVIARLALLLVAVLLVAASPAAAKCTQNSECRPSSCCHALSCVDAASAPNCDDAMCTAQCIPFTLDCGGVCRCSSATGECEAAMRAGVSPVGGPTKAPEPPKNKKMIKITIKTTVKK